MECWWSVGVLGVGDRSMAEGRSRALDAPSNYHLELNTNKMNISTPQTTKKLRQPQPTSMMRSISHSRNRILDRAGGSDVVCGGSYGLSFFSLAMFLSVNGVERGFIRLDGYGGKLAGPPLSALRKASDARSTPSASYDDDGRDRSLEKQSRVWHPPRRAKF